MERRTRRQDARRSGVQARAGNRRPEWRCARCMTTNWATAQNTVCRRCDKDRDHWDEYIDEYGTGQSPGPKPSDVAIGSVAHAAACWHSASDGWGHTRDTPSPEGPPTTKRQRRQPQTAPTTPTSQLVALRTQLKAAEDTGMAEAILTLLRDDVAMAQAEATKQRPIGQRYDQAKAAFSKAVDACERKERIMEEAKGAYEDAQLEVHRTHDEFQNLTNEARVGGREPTDTDTLARRLAENLKEIQACISAHWPGSVPLLPARLAHCLEASAELIEETQSDVETVEDSASSLSEASYADEDEMRGAAALKRAGQPGQETEMDAEPTEAKTEYHSMTKKNKARAKRVPKPPAEGEKAPSGQETAPAGGSEAAGANEGGGDPKRQRLADMADMQPLPTLEEAVNHKSPMQQTIASAKRMVPALKAGSARCGQRHRSRTPARE